MRYKISISTQIIVGPENGLMSTAFNGSVTSTAKYYRLGILGLVVLGLLMPQHILFVLFRLDVAIL